MKSQLSSETKRNIRVNLAEKTSGLVSETIAREDQSHQDLTKYIYLTGIIGWALSLFQLGKIFYLKTALGVSYYYWIGYLVVAAMWLTYGIYYKNKAVTIVYSIWIAVIIATINLIIIYP